MFDWIKRLAGAGETDGPLITMTLIYRDRGRDGLEAVFDLHGQPSSAVMHWTGMNVRHLTDSVPEGTMRLAKGWFELLKDRGFVEATWDGRRWVVVGSTANVDLRLVARPVLRIPEQVLTILAAHGANLMRRTDREPVVDVSIEFAVAEETDFGSSSEETIGFPTSGGDILTEEESATVGRLVALGYAMADDDRREGYSREPRRVESVDQATVPVTGTWSSEPASIVAPSGTADVYAVPSSNAYDR